ncbi:MAG: hypothetical protein V1746_00190 [bacterium]
MKRFFFFLFVAAVGFSPLVLAQSPPPLPDDYGNQGGGATPTVVEEPPPPVRIKGKDANTLSDDEKREFLQEKIRTIYHEDGQVELLRVAPGYPLTLSFSESIGTVTIGDSGAFAVEKVGDDKTSRLLLIKALKREGDTPLQVFFSGDKLRVYHLFIVKDFVEGETAVRVVSFGRGGGGGGSGMDFGWGARGKLDVRTITQVIRNYDALAQEKAIDSRMVKRDEVFRDSKITSFTTYYIYRFAGGPTAVSFAYTNPYPYPIRYDESRLRIAIGNVRYIPDYVAFHKNTLAPGESTTGFAVVARPAFDFNQAFDLIWK